MAHKAIHGHYSDERWSNPRLVAESNEACRGDQGNTITANEYLDEPEVLRAKIKKIAQLIKRSKYTCVYTGAGLSRSSGIPDYATKAKNSVVNGPTLTNSLDALPTYAHRVITAMEKNGYIQYYVQQNHDGLPQKSGFPQDKMNEIHGAWFDPSNPVVQFSGDLRTDLFKDMLVAEKKADLCLCLGTSLSGMNADRMANTPAEKMLKGKALGTVIINLQRTPLDDSCAIRVWAKLDDAFTLLVQELNINEDQVRRLPNNGTPLPNDGDLFRIPYNAKGIRSDTEHSVLDLRVGAKIKICAPGASNGNAIGTIYMKTSFGWSVELQEKKLVRRAFGKWMIEAALRGALPHLPLVNISPKVFEPRTEQEEGRDLVVQVIQSHRHVGQNKHEWALRIADDCVHDVSQVTYTLHPTFHNPIRLIDEAPFTLNCTGWGTFEVKVLVELNNGTHLSGTHALTFEKDGTNVAVTVIQ